MIDLGQIDLGQIREIVCQFQLQDDTDTWVNTNPVTVQFEIALKGQPKTVYTYGIDGIVERLSSTGKYQVAWLCTAPGRYEAAWIADGVVEDRQECTFYVRLDPLYTPPA